MESIIIKIVFSFVFSFLITFFLVPICSRLAYTLNLIDIPDGKIKKHAKPTPYLGGIAVYVGFLCGICLTLPIENKLFLLFIGTTLLLLIGLIDDLLILKPYQKFFGQIIAALSFLKAGFYLKEHFFHTFLNLIVSFVWILTIINAFNLVDIMDGLASTLAIGALVAFGAIALLTGNMIVLIVIMAFLGSLIAFLWYNKPPAKIYLGDTGSLMIGGFLSVIPFCLDWGIYNRYGFIVPIIILAIPLLEVVSLIIIRMYKKIPFYYASPDHFACYLRANGWTIYSILGYIFSLSLILGCVGICFFFNYLALQEISITACLFLCLWGKILQYI